MRAQAQQRAALAAGWLRSDDPVQVAWGAWVARSDRKTDLIPLLREKLAAYMPNNPDRDRRDAMMEVLDVAIQLGVTLPAGEAKRFYPEFAAQAMILLIRSGERAEAAFLDIFDTTKFNAVWLAAEMCWSGCRRPPSVRGC
jgi:hypothetical protein